MSWLKYIRQIIVGLITVGFVFGAYSTANYSNDPDIFKIIISGILLVLLNVGSFIRTWSLNSMDVAYALRMEINKIKKKLDLVVEDQEEIKEAEEKMAKIKKSAIIPSIFEYILWVIVVIYLLGAVS